MEFDPRGADPKIGLRVRNLVDPPGETPRGGGSVEATASATGRVPTCSLPEVSLLPDADVLLSSLDGRPLRGSRTQRDGKLMVRGLAGVKPGETILATARSAKKVVAKEIVTGPPAG